jgi:RNA polymerase sigma-70 factor, ECF subfamily
MNSRNTNPFAAQWPTGIKSKTASRSYLNVEHAVDALSVFLYVPPGKGACGKGPMAQQDRVMNGYPGDGGLKPMAPRPGTAGTGHIADLLRRVAAGDRAAFAALYAATSAKLYGVILRILARRDVADDILQDVYVRIWERAVDYNAAKGSPITWMAAIARNRAIDEVRRKSLPSIEDNAAALEVASDDRGALAWLEQGEEVKRLFKCLEQLQPERREAVLLAYRDGASRAALGKHFDRPVPTVKTWIRRSLAQLRDCLSQ